MIAGKLPINPHLTHPRPLLLQDARHPTKENCLPKPSQDIRICRTTNGSHGFQQRSENPRPWMVFSGFVTSLCDLWINVRGGGRWSRTTRGVGSCGFGNIGEREYEAGVCVWVVTLDSNLKDGSLCDGSQCLFYFQLNFGKLFRLTGTVIFSINGLESDQLIQDGLFPCSRLKISRHGLDCWNITLYPGYSATTPTTTTTTTTRSLSKSILLKLECM